MKKLLLGAAVVAALCLPATAQTQTPFIASDNSSERVGVTASANGTTGATAATLPAVPGFTTYICGFNFGGSNATAGDSTTAVTVVGVISGTMTFAYTTIAAGVAIPPPLPLTVNFIPCEPASAVNTAIVVNGPALGTGATFAAVNAWGYQVRQ